MVTRAERLTESAILNGDDDGTNGAPVLGGCTPLAAASAKAIFDSRICTVDARRQQGGCCDWRSAVHHLLFRSRAGETLPPAFAQREGHGRDPRISDR